MAADNRLSQWFRNETDPLVFSASTLTDDELNDRIYTLHFHEQSAINLAEGEQPLFSWVGSNDTVSKTVTFVFPASDVNRVGRLYWELWRELVSTGSFRIIKRSTTEFKAGLR